jgi:hypothetical protein
MARQRIQFKLRQPGLATGVAGNDRGTLAMESKQHHDGASDLGAIDADMCTTRQRVRWSWVLCCSWSPLDHDALKNKMGAIQFPPKHYGNDQELAKLPDENVGWCLLCDGPIRSEKEMIKNSNTHNCPEGLKLESRLR